MNFSSVLKAGKFSYQICWMSVDSQGLIGPHLMDESVAIILGFHPTTPSEEQESVVLPSYISYEGWDYPVSFLGNYQPGLENNRKWIPFTGNQNLKEVIFPPTMVDCQKNLFTDCLNLESVVLNHLFGGSDYYNESLELFTGCYNLKLILNRSKYSITANDFGGVPPDDLKVYHLNCDPAAGQRCGRVHSGADLSAEQPITLLRFTPSSSKPVDLLVVIESRTSTEATIVGTLAELLDRESYLEYFNSQMDLNDAKVKIRASNLNIVIPNDSEGLLYNIPGNGALDYFGNTIDSFDTNRIRQFNILPYAFANFNSFETVSLSGIHTIGKKAFLNSFNPELAGFASVDTDRCWIGEDGENYTRYFETEVSEEDGLGQQSWQIASYLNELKTELTYGCEYTYGRLVAPTSASGSHIKFCKDRVQYRGEEDLNSWNNHLPLRHRNIKTELTVPKEPTCTEAGFSGGYRITCETCNLDEIIDGTLLPKLGHSLEVVEVAEGKGEVICTRCKSKLPGGTQNYFYYKANWVKDNFNLEENSEPFVPPEKFTAFQKIFAQDAHNVKRIKSLKE